MYWLRWLNMHRLRVQLFAAIVWKPITSDAQVLTVSEAWAISKKLHDVPWDYRRGRPAIRAWKGGR